MSAAYRRGEDITHHTDAGADMFTTLLESRAPRQRRAGSAITSAVLHGAAIAAIVAMSLPGRGDAKLAPPKEAKVRFIPIARPPVSQPKVAPPSSAVHQVPVSVPTRVIIAPVNVPTSLPPIDLGAPPLGDEPITIGRPGFALPGVSGPPIGSDGSAVAESLVDRTPRLLPGAPDPRYPNSLRSSGMSGQVVVRFVIDTLGRAELGTLTTVETSHVLFAESVREALGRFRFTPGEASGRKVRTMVQIPFTFALK